MARSQRTPRFPMGTRVLKYFTGYPEPFGGSVDTYSRESGYYHIQYDDGDSEEMTEEDVETYMYSLPTAPKAAAKATPEPVKRAPSPRASRTAKPLSPKPSASSTVRQEAAPVAATKPDTPSPSSESSSNGSVPSTSPKSNEPDAETINKLIGQRVCKTLMENGEVITVVGAVSSYFPATKMYRVLYYNGSCDDLSYEDVVDSIPLNSPRSTELKKRKSTDRTQVAPCASPKKPKTYDVVDNKKPEDDETTQASTSTRKKTTEETPSSTSSTSTDAVEALDQALCYAIMRNTLFLVVSTKSVTHKHKEKQLSILSSEEIKPKRSLELFVKEGGLGSLVELLSLWTQDKETEQGVFLILKLLYVMPGISPDAVLSSKVGKKIREIEKMAGRYDCPAKQVTDVATSIIVKWKRDFGDRKGDSAKRKEEPSAEIKSPRERREDPIPKLKSPRESMNSKVNEPKANDAQSVSNHKPANDRAPKTSNSANHLKHLFSSSRRDAPRDVLGNVLGAKVARPLGPAYARKPKRSTVLIDSLADRKVRTDAAHAEAQKQREAKATEEKELAARVQKIKFGDEFVMVFSKDMEVARLLTPTAPLKPGPHPSSSWPPTNKAPMKSSLKVKGNSPAGTAKESPMTQAPPALVVKVNAVDSSKIAESEPERRFAPIESVQAPGESACENSRSRGSIEVTVTTHAEDTGVTISDQSSHAPLDTAALHYRDQHVVDQNVLDAADEDTSYRPRKLSSPPPPPAPADDEFDPSPPTTPPPPPPLETGEDPRSPNEDGEILPSPPRMIGRYQRPSASTDNNNAGELGPENDAAEENLRPELMVEVESKEMRDVVSVSDVAVVSPETTP